MTQMRLQKQDIQVYTANSLPPTNCLESFRSSRSTSHVVSADPFLSLSLGLHRYLLPKSWDWYLDAPGEPISLMFSQGFTPSCQEHLNALWFPSIRQSHMYFSTEMERCPLNFEIFFLGVASNGMTLRWGTLLCCLHN